MKWPIKKKKIKKIIMIVAVATLLISGMIPYLPFIIK